MRIYIPKMKLKLLKNRTIALLGYGSQGRAIGLNLKDSGCNLIIGLPANSKSKKIAKKDKFRNIVTVSKAVSEADIICFAFPDHLHGRVYKKDISPYLKNGCCLWFLHGLSVHFQFVKPPRQSDVIMIAPHGPGVAVREKYLSDRSISAFYSVNQNFSKKAKELIIELAEAVGFAKKKLIKTSFKDEAIGDLFGEQAILCGGMASLIKAGFDILKKNSHSSDSAYLEVAYQLDLIIDLIKKFGIEGMYSRISVAARYGSYLNGQKIIDRSVKKRMELIYQEIASGKFPRKLNSLTSSDIKSLNKKVSSLSSKAFEKSAKKFSQ